MNAENIIVENNKIGNEEIKNEITKLYNRFIISRNQDTLKKIISMVLDDTDHPNTREFFDFKIDNETLFDIIIKLKIDLNYSAIKYICSQTDLLIKAVKNGNTQILDVCEESDLFTKKIDNLSLFEYTIKNNTFNPAWFDNLKEKHNIVEILKKYNKENYLIEVGEAVLFDKYDDNKLVIEYLLEKNMLFSKQISNIKEHHEIFDYLIKYNLGCYIGFLSDEVLQSKKDNKMILESVLEMGISPNIDTIKNNETVNILLKYKKYRELYCIDIEHAFYEVPGTDKKLFEFLISEGIVSKNVINEIYYNGPKANEIYDILYRNNRLDILDIYFEGQLHLKYGKDETLLESLLKNNESLSVHRYELKESYELLLKYNKYEELAKCSEKLLLNKLPNGKKLYEELIDRNIEINTSIIESTEIVEKIIKDKKYEQLSCLSSKILLSQYDLNKTCLEKIIDISNKTNNFDMLNYLVMNYSNLNEKAKIYIILAKNNIHNIHLDISLDELLNLQEGTTLLNELLKEDKKTTTKLILTEKQKSNVDVAALLKIYGIIQKNINYEIVTENIAEEYTNQVINEYNQMPISKEQENLLKELYEVMNDGKSDITRINALISAYRYLLSTNNQYASEIYHLITLKKQNPNFKIESTNETSHYSGEEQTIRLETLNIGILNHEIGHALHDMIDNFSIPSGFEKLIKKHKRSFRTRVMLTTYSKKCEEIYIKVAEYVDSILMPEYDKKITQEERNKIQKYLDSLSTTQKQKYEEKNYSQEFLEKIFGATITVEDYLKQTRKIQRNELIENIVRTEYNYLVVIGDMFDGIYDGKFKDGKMKDMFGLTHLRYCFGHGEEYYSGNTDLVFEEMIATYSEIMKSRNPEEGLKMMRYFLGDELIKMISDYYNQNLCYNYSYVEQEHKTL